MDDVQAAEGVTTAGATLDGVCLDLCTVLPPSSKCLRTVRSEGTDWPSWNSGGCRSSGFVLCFETGEFYDWADGMSSSPITPSHLFLEELVR